MKDFFESASQGGFQSLSDHLQDGCDVNTADSRGRTALHICSAKGFVDCCSLLLRFDAHLYVLDRQGNSPFHIASLENHKDILELLYEHARVSIMKMYLNDLFIANEETFTFLSISELIFDRVQKIKLSSHDLPRYEKQWLIDGYLELSNVLHSKYLHLIPPVNPEVIDYVLSTLDPRPEAGIYKSNPLYNPLQPDDILVFVPTIPSSLELSELLWQCLRMSALDVRNALWRRTPLHVACDANIVDSHKDIIFYMLNECGCNCLLKDKNGRVPMDLLIQDKANLPSAPTASRLAEELIISRREDHYESIEAQDLASESSELASRRIALLESCASLACKDSPLLWDARRNVAEQLFVYRNWVKFVDIGTKNLFYGRVTDSISEGNFFDCFSWELPIQATEIHRVDSIVLWCFLNCTLLRSIGDWDMFLCRKTGAELYLHRHSIDLRYTVPNDIDWTVLLKNSESLEKLGFYQEWTSMRDEHGNIFYFNFWKNEGSWQRPIDAEETPIHEQLCYGCYVIINLLLMHAQHFLG